MEPEPLDVIPSVWRACIGFALSQTTALMVMVVLSAVEHPEPSSTEIRGTLQIVAPEQVEQHRDELLCDAPRIIPADLRCLVVTAGVSSD